MIQVVQGVKDTKENHFEAITSVIHKPENGVIVSHPYTNESVITYMDELEMNDRRVQTNAQVIGSRPSSRRTSLHLETDNTFNGKPNYGPEVEDLEPSGRRNGDDENSDEDRGIDDGFLSPRTFSPRPSDGNIPGTPFDVNYYQQKKTLAQGMMDIALLSANANQLRYVLGSRSHPFYYASLSMISMSLILQIVVGIGLIWNSRYDVKEDSQVSKANRTNNWTVIGIFLVTVINIFISSFGVIDPPDVITFPLKNAADEEATTEPL